MSDDIRRELLFRRRNRCVGKLLGTIEGEPYWQQLTKEQQERFRALVKECISEYHSDALTLLETPPGTRFNAVATKAKDTLNDRADT